MRKLWQVMKGTPTSKILRRLRENPDLRAELDQLDIYFASDQVKEERHKLLAELLVTVDEKASEYELQMREQMERINNALEVFDAIYEGTDDLQAIHDYRQMLEDKVYQDYVNNRKRLRKKRTALVNLLEAQRPSGTVTQVTSRRRRQEIKLRRANNLKKAQKALKRKRC